MNQELQKYLDGEIGLAARPAEPRSEARVVESFLADAK